MGELFHIERQIAEAPKEEREESRHRESRFVVDPFFAWCEASAVRALDATPLAKGVLRYALNQRRALERFLDDGRLPIRRVGRWRGCGRLPVAVLRLSIAAPQSGLP
jgi:transposase